MALVVPRSFLADDFSDGGLIKEMEKHFSFLGQFALDDNSFYALGVVGYKTKVQFWQRNSDMDGWKSQPYTTEVHDGVQLDAIGVGFIRSKFLDEAQRFFRKHRTHILLEIARHKDESAEFTYRLQRNGSRWIYRIRLSKSLWSAPFPA